MKVAGLITEYNPFHNGHLYHIQKAKEATGADALLVVMSGNYVQRGAPAMLPKRIRTEMALKAGASAVLELPVCFSLGSAEYFAAGAVSLLDKLNCIDSICFGSECEDSKVLESIADILAEEPDRYRVRLQEALKEGRSFPLARQTAIKEYLKGGIPNTVLKYPNNILGVEYIKALRLMKSSIKACPVKRVGSGYHDENLNKDYSSASAIRRLISCNENSDILPCLKEQVPSFCIPLLKDTYGRRYPVHSNDFSLLLKQRLLSESSDSLTRYMDVTENLANRMINHLDDFITFDRFCEKIKTKDMTYSRISRCLFHILLGITEKDMHLYKRNGFCQYARILGFRKDGASLISILKKQSAVPLVTKLTRTELLSNAGRKMLSLDISSSNLYESVITDKFKTPFINEYRQQLIIC